MRRLTAAALLVALFGGCATYRGSRRAAIVGAVGTALSVVGTLYCLEACFDRRESSAPRFGAEHVVVLAGLIAGLSFGALMVYGLGDPEPSPPAKRPDELSREREAQLAAQRRERALDLIKSARAAAYAHDCAAVKRREIQVRDLAPDLHTTLFLREVAIRRCLDAASGAGDPPAVSP
jgi:hypothetical protein